MQENKYIGDEKMTKMLAHYHCPTPLEIVKMRFAGAICSPNLDLRPSDVISSFWPQGQSPRLQTKDEADLFFKFFMGLWDDIFTRIKNNKFRLEKVPGHDLSLYCERRYAEVELGYVEGFWGGRQDVKIPAYLAEIIDRLSELADAYATLAKKSAGGANAETIRPALHSCDEAVDKLISFVIEQFVLPRIENLRRVVN